MANTGCSTTVPHCARNKTARLIYSKNTGEQTEGEILLSTTRIGKMKQQAIAAKESVLQYDGMCSTLYKHSTELWTKLKYLEEKVRFPSAGAGVMSDFIPEKKKRRKKEHKTHNNKKRSYDLTAIRYNTKTYNISVRQTEPFPPPYSSRGKCFSTKTVHRSHQNRARKQQKRGTVVKKWKYIAHTTKVTWQGGFRSFSIPPLFLAFYICLRFNALALFFCVVWYFFFVSYGVVSFSPTRERTTHRASWTLRSASSSTSLLDPRMSTVMVLPVVGTPVTFTTCRNATPGKAPQIQYNRRNNNNKNVHCEISNRFVDDDTFTKFWNGQLNTVGEELGACTLLIVTNQPDRRTLREVLKLLLTIRIY